MLEQVQLKQRLVGGLVLLSLAVIFVPFLMDDPREEVKILESNIPAWPTDQPLNVIEIDEEAFSPIVEPIQQQPALPAINGKPAVAEKQAVPVSKPAEKKIVKAEPPKKKPVASSGKRWEVQVVSYSRKSRKRAERFLKRMRDKGYEVSLKEGKRIRLVTAPVGSEKAAKALKKKIDKAFKVDQVNSMVRLLK